MPRPLRQALGGGWKSPLQSLWRRLTEPVTATAVQAVVMWAWHAPPLFDRALDSFGWHIAQHACFFLSSLLFWWAMLHPRGRDAGYGVSAACLFATSLIGGALGALMSFSSSPWYADYAAMGMTGIGLDPIDDQRLAGLIMWIPGGLVHGVAALVLFYKWLKVGGGQPCCALRPLRLSFARARGAGVRRRDLSASSSNMPTSARSCGCMPRRQPAAIRERGEAMFIQYGCGSCHALKNVRTATGAVGPPLDGIALRVIIGGHLVEHAGQHAALDPRPAACRAGHRNARPHVGAGDARDITAFLYTRAK